MEIIELLESIHITSHEFQIFIISALPIIELRGAIPVGHFFNINPITVFFLAYFGSMLPVPFLLKLINPIFKRIRNYPFFRSQIDKVTHRTLKKINHVKKISLIGLIIFVGIPLPGTGVWTGSLAACLTNLEFKKAFFAISIGNILAGLLVSLITFTTFHIF